MSAISYEIESLYGFCPVQAYGVIEGKKFYFRARWAHWSVSVYDREEDFMTPDWYYEESYTEMGPLGAGWMELDDARAFLDRTLQAYMAGVTTMKYE